MKKRKFLSVFAILIVAIFALSACFFAACKGGDKEDDNPDDGTEQGGGATPAPTPTIRAAETKIRGRETPLPATRTS